jgi:hypothetical protein
MALRVLKTTVACLAAGLALAGLATGAWAGEYHVYSCRTPAGLVAPTDGWSSPPHPVYDPTSNTCESGGGLVAALEAGYEHAPDSETDKATWAFQAPTGETITEATLWRAGETPGGGESSASYLFWLSGGASLGLHAHPFDECNAGKGCIGEGSFDNPLASQNRVIAPSSTLNSSYLSLSAYCGSPYETLCPAGKGGEDRYDAIVELFAADLVLSQPTPPTVSAVGGGLAEDPTVQGTTDVAFHAADSGSGVYEVLFQVDGQVVSRGGLDEDGGRCRDVGGTSDGLPAFLYTQPCPAALSADVPFDTSGLANGVHHLVVSVTDAAGNATTVLDREITVANPLPPAAPPAAGAACAESAGAGALAAGERPALLAGWQGHAGARLRGRFGAAHTLAGQLTEGPPPAHPGDGAGGDRAGGYPIPAHPGGSPIPDAPVEVCELPAYAGAHPRLLATLRTDAAGRFSLVLPRNLPSCTLRLTYRPDPLDALPAATRTLTLTVPAALSLRIAPRTAPSAGAIRFSGRLLGDPLPAGGKQLVLEARAPGGRWLEFHVIRTRALGRFGYLYRFRLPGPARYQFRVLCEAEDDFPFAAGASSVVGVFER